MPDAITQAAELIQSAEALIITAGAGMGADSGLPTYRGSNGFETVYPVVKQLRLTYRDLARPTMMDRDPYLAWGFHALFAHLFRSAQPHAGFAILNRWVAAASFGGFVYTSNVDGFFQRAGFDPDIIVECHGTTMLLQCSIPCGDHTWEAASHPVKFVEATMRALDPLPRCDKCGALARPNVRLFDDFQWVSRNTVAQSSAFEKWKANRLGRSMVIIECGAGTAVPAVRLAGESAMGHLGAKLIRINPHDAKVPAGGVSVAMSAMEALANIDRCLNVR